MPLDIKDGDVFAVSQDQLMADIEKQDKQLAETQALLRDRTDALYSALRQLGAACERLGGSAYEEEFDMLNYTQVLAQVTGAEVLERLLAETFTDGANTASVAMSDAELTKAYHEGVREGQDRCLKAADEMRTRIANDYQDRAEHGASKMDGNCDWYKLEGAVAVVQAIRNLDSPSGLPDGAPCGHRGCLSHIGHPCEGCGRVGGKRAPNNPMEVFSHLRATGRGV